MTIKRALLSDAEKIFTVLKPYYDSGIILERSLQEISDNINYFTVSLDDAGSAIGCVSYHEYSKNLKEIRSLAVKKEFTEKGIGSQMMRFLLKELLDENPSTKIFTLTVVPDFFSKHGFKVVDKETLPEKIWKDCIKCHHKDNCDETAMVYLP